MVCTYCCRVVNVVCRHCDMQLLEGVKMLAAQGGGWSIQVQIHQCCGFDAFLTLCIRGPGMEKNPDPGSGIREEHPG
jgi:hypothetical protein